MIRSTRQRPSSRAAALAVATVALYAGGNLAGLLHLALAKHEVCAEHGAMVHGGNAHVHAPAASSPAVDAGAALATAVAPAGHDHDHCDVGDHLRESGLPTPPAVDAPPAPPVDRTASRPVGGTYRSIALLRLAPKHSPPATT